MKRILIMLAVFMAVCAVAAYVALAPLAPGSGGFLSILDAAAERIAAFRGRDNAVLGLLALGVLLAILAAAVTQDSRPKNSPAIPIVRHTIASAQDEAEPPQPALETASDQRIAALRRRAIGARPLEETAPPAAETVPLGPEPSEALSEIPVAPSLSPRPVVLVRKPRDRDRDWTREVSWLGGLPRLGDRAWPRDPAGVPLPFAAQIDLADLAAACPESPLPRSGSLAFFLGTGALVEVPEGRHDFTEPPPDLPPAFEEDGYAFPPTETRRSRICFPYWPVEAVTLDLPETLRNPALETDHAEIEAAMEELLRQRVPHRSGQTFMAQRAGEAVEALWWIGVIHLANRLYDARDGAPRLIALKADRVQQLESAHAALEANPDATADRIALTADTLASARAELAGLERQRDALPEMIAAMDEFTAERDPWERLSAGEIELVEDILAEAHASYGQLVHRHLPQTIAPLATLCLRTMVSGPPEAVAAMPDAQLDRINGEHALPELFQHQMFGLASALSTGSWRHPRDEHAGDLLLLQLGYDSMMEWRWGDIGLYQFWISPQDIASRNWNAVRLTFEGG